jgi:hypothetical protein
VFDSLTTKSAVPGRAQAQRSVVSEANEELVRQVVAVPKATISVIDQVLGVLQDDTSHWVFIGDLAFEQVLNHQGHKTARWVGAGSGDDQRT